MITKINWHPSKQDVRKFGLTMIIGFAMIGGLLWWKKTIDVALWVWGVSFLIGLCAILFPRLSKPFYFSWMGIALVMGTIMSILILLIIFYLLLTPVALWMRLIGRDALKLKKESFKDGNYFLPHPETFDKEYFKRLF